MIYPVPAKIELNGEFYTPDCVSLYGDCTSEAAAIFKNKGISLGDGFPIEFRLCENSDLPENYTITINGGKAVVTLNSASAVRFAAYTFAKLILNGELRGGVIEDGPKFKKRGYIEGFYGKTWSHEKRESVMRLMSEYGMNTYYYAPKDDIYHRERWRELYPDAELASLNRLVELAGECGMQFNWCVGPGLSYNYCSQKDFDCLIEKFKSLYKIGVKSFGLLLDDIPREFQYEDDAARYATIADAHTELVNNTYKALKEFDASITLTVCPTQYSGDEHGEYIKKFGSGIPSDVFIFWTGEEICSRVLTVRECLELKESTGRNVLFWDNYPVNDCEMFHEMHLGALIGRDKDLYTVCDGLISNVMEYAECSKIPLMTVADYLWNPIDYNPGKSLKNAHKVILGDKAELFSYFADHLGVSCLSKYSSAYMSDKLAHIAFLASKGEIDAAFSEFSEYNANMRRCYEMLCDESVELFKELKKWVIKFGMCCDLLDAIFEARRNPTEENMKKLSELTHTYNFDAVVLTGFCLREAAEKTLGLY